MALRGSSWLPPTLASSADQRRSLMPSWMLLGQLLFWVLLAALCLSYVSSGESVDAMLLRHEQEKREANVVKLNEQTQGIPGSDKRGWIMSPLHAAAEYGLGGATSCIDVHSGVIGPKLSRANHRHHVKNETFLVWGATAKWRIENLASKSGYFEVEFKDSDVSVFSAPAGRAHALINLDKSKWLNLMVCADTEWDPKNPDTDYHIWKDL